MEEQNFWHFKAKEHNENQNYRLLSDFLIWIKIVMRSWEDFFHNVGKVYIDGVNLDRIAIQIM